MRRCACSTNTTRVMTIRASSATPATTKAPLSVWYRFTAWPGTEAMIETKISIDMPLPTPRSVMSSPSHMMTAVPAVMVMTRHEDPHDPVVGMIGFLALREQVPERARAMMPVDCSTARRDGEVARVLRDLGLAGLALLLQLLEPRDHHDEQLQDDRGRDVRHDPEREHRQLQQRAAAEQVHQAVDALALDLRRHSWMAT
jgi:hypothetical protein